MTAEPSVTDVDQPEGAVALLRTTAAIRERARRLTERARCGDSRWFTVDDDALSRAADEVASVTRERFPDNDIPFHSRWRHFEAGGIDRTAGLDVRAMVDLAVVAVLLDAGSGPDWHFDEQRSGRRFARSEGLGVASWHAFDAGAFSSDPAIPHRVDADGLAALDAERLGAAFQVSASNPLVGLTGRVALLHRLGRALTDSPAVFGEQCRPSGLFDVLAAAEPAAGPVTAASLLTLVLDSLSSIWPCANVIGDRPVGDCWRHQALTGPGATAGWMPFHKLSQWLTYSLLEPFGAGGIDIADVDGLTGLPEYRNGGLLLDTGVLALRDSGCAEATWSVGDELVVEWRALTVALLDELAPMVRDRLGLRNLPLACVLEGGTWAAGRALAQRLRGGLPPLRIDSDGTVF